MRKSRAAEDCFALIHPKLREFRTMLFSGVKGGVGRPEALLEFLDAGMGIAEGKDNDSGEENDSLCVLVGDNGY